MTIFGTLARLVSRPWFSALCTVMIAGVGFSRVIIGVHYPTDVLVGWGIGLLSVCGLTAVQRRVGSQTLIGAVIALAMLPGWFFCVSTDFYSLYGLMVGLVAAFWFEERYVKFENTRNVVRAAVRTLFGVAVFAALSEGLKLPFPAALREGGTFTAHLIRAARYAVSIFAALGVYPMVFRYTAKLGRKQEE